jgi:hypothetical protein
MQVPLTATPQTLEDEEPCALLCKSIWLKTSLPLVQGSAVEVGVWEEGTAESTEAPTFGMCSTSAHLSSITSGCKVIACELALRIIHTLLT